MTPPPRGAGKEQRLLRNARREGRLILTVWLAALVWSSAAAVVAGYGRDPDDITLVLGFPDWVFWGVVLPWGICLLFTVWFCFGYMADDDLGQDRAEDPGHG
jgi:hypothetical protein